jgi:hypothetical protein
VHAPDALTAIPPLAFAGAAAMTEPQQIAASAAVVPINRARVMSSS